MDELLSHWAVTVCLHIKRSSRQTNQLVCTRCDPLIWQMWLFDVIFQNWGLEHTLKIRNTGFVLVRHRIRPAITVRPVVFASQAWCHRGWSRVLEEARAAWLNSAQLSRVWDMFEVRRTRRSRWNMAATLSSTRECLTRGGVESMRLHSGAVYQHKKRLRER